MLESSALEQTDLLGRTEPVVPALLHPVEQLACLAGVGDLGSVDAVLLERCLLLVCCRCHLPGELGDVSTQIFGGDGHLVLQRVDQLGLLLALLGELVGKRFLALGDHLV